MENKKTDYENEKAVFFMKFNITLGNQKVFATENISNLDSFRQENLRSMNLLSVYDMGVND